MIFDNAVGFPGQKLIDKVNRTSAYSINCGSRCSHLSYSCMFGAIENACITGVHSYNLMEVITKRGIVIALHDFQSQIIIHTGASPVAVIEITHSWNPCAARIL